MDKIVDLADVSGRCTKRRARNVKKNATFLLSPAETVRYIARIVSPSAEIAAVNKQQGFSDLYC